MIELPSSSAIDWSTVQTTRHLGTAAGRAPSTVTTVLHLLQEADGPRRMDALMREAGDRVSPDVAPAVSVLVAQGLASRTPHGYTATKLGRRATSPAGPGESRLPRSGARSRRR
ncbi:MAG: hypothetical protein QOH30_1207 [Baekduia sp.]|nr:hypothetical protein [Conexibacter sp.]MDX6714649.1 hypothetical protein [Baekduia sp.]MDX6731214.1 hypothetical protein [Baekduia sp.]